MIPNCDFLKLGFFFLYEILIKVKLSNALYDSSIFNSYLSMIKSCDIHLCYDTKECKLKYVIFRVFNRCLSKIHNCDIHLYFDIKQINPRTIYFEYLLGVYQRFETVIFTFIVIVK